MEPSIYSDIILELYRHPPNYGELKEHNFSASGGNNTCGDTACFQAKIQNQKIVEITFTGEGCAISKASCALLTEMVKGKTITEALALEPKNMFDNLGQIIQTRIKCALLGLTILKQGLKQFDEKKTKTQVNGIKV